MVTKFGVIWYAAIDNKAEAVDALARVLGPRVTGR